MSEPVTPRAYIRRALAQLLKSIPGVTWVEGGAPAGGAMPRATWDLRDEAQDLSRGGSEGRSTASEFWSAEALLEIEIHEKSPAAFEERVDRLVHEIAATVRSTARPAPYNDARCRLTVLRWLTPIRQPRRNQSQSEGVLYVPLLVEYRIDWR